MTFEIGALLLLLAAAMVVFALEWLAVDLVAIALVVALVLLGILTPAEAFAGFASEVIIILASIFVLSGTLVRTGIMEAVGRALLRLGSGESRLVAAVMTLSASLSSILSNTNTTAILTPAVMEFSRRAKLSPSRFLIPLAYASMLGGAGTLIGTSANLAASGFMERAGLEPLGLFELLPLGIVMIVLGVLWMTFVGVRYLPHTARPSLAEEYELGRYLSELAVTSGSTYEGQRVEELGLGAQDINILAVARDDRRMPPREAGRLRAGDRLLVEAERSRLLDLEAKPEVEFDEADPLRDADLVGDDMVLVEGLVMPGSRLEGRSARAADLRRRFAASVLALQRRGVAHPVRLGEMALRVGDVVLLRGPAERLAALEASGAVRLFGEVSHEPQRSRHGMIVLAALIGAVLAGSTGLLPLSIAFALAVLVVVLSGCVGVEEIYGMVDWRVIVLIGGMTSFGLAMQKTQAADWLARLIAGATLPFGVYAVMAAFVVLTMVLTQPLSNAAAALVVLPVALSTAAEVGIDPRSLAVLVTLAASLSFIAPFEPACLLVFSPGKYRFRDFVTAGIPLSLLSLIVLLALVPVIWPLS